MEGFARSKARLVDSEWRASTTRARKSCTERAEESDLILLASGEASRRPPLHRSDSKAVESQTALRIFGCFLLDRCGSACCATSLNQTYSRRSSTRSTALAASCPVASDSAGSPSKQRVGAPTVPAPASTLAPFGLEDHQVPSKVSVSLC
ncbi:hypothetical protein AHAS_Ahas19G0207400 [Arachis hypogaea]